MVYCCFDVVVVALVVAQVFKNVGGRLFKYVTLLLVVWLLLVMLFAGVA